MILDRGILNNSMEVDIFTFVQYSHVTQSKFVSKQVNNVSFILKRLMCYQSFMQDTVSPLNVEECICTFQTV